MGEKKALEETSTKEKQLRSSPVVPSEPWREVNARSRFSFSATTSMPTIPEPEAKRSGSSLGHNSSANGEVLDVN